MSDHPLHHLLLLLFFFFFMVPAPPEIYTLSLHDALPIYRAGPPASASAAGSRPGAEPSSTPAITSTIDRKSTRLNSSHTVISYAVFCLKKKKKKKKIQTHDKNETTTSLTSQTEHTRPHYN